jgi:predicted nucleic acid-binding protein
VAYLLDTSILVRLANTADAFYLSSVQAVVTLHRRGEVLHVTAQNLVEFRSVATRPMALNGLGLSPVDVEAKTATFPLLEEMPNIYPAWKSLVMQSGIIGKQVHDARLVAVCHAHGVTHLLTFNTPHFTRFSGFGPGIVVVDPVSV